MTTITDVAKVLLTLSAIYAAYYFGYRSAQANQKANPRFFDKTSKPLSSDKKDNVGALDHPFNDKVSEIKDQVQSSLHKAENSMPRSTGLRDFTYQVEDVVSDAAHEIKKPLKPFQRSFVRSAVDKIEDASAGFKHEAKKEWKSLRR